MRVVLINGSPHKQGNTFLALSEVAKTLEEQGIGAEIVHIGTKALQGCIACGKCAELGHFTILNMPLVPTQYWNMAHGREPGDVLQDLEGLQTMRTLGRNMAWLLNQIHNDGGPYPDMEPMIRTDFIR